VPSPASHETTTNALRPGLVVPVPAPDAELAELVPHPRRIPFGPQFVVRGEGAVEFLDGQLAADLPVERTDVLDDRRGRPRVAVQVLDAGERPHIPVQQRPAVSRLSAYSMIALRCEKEGVVIGILVIVRVAARAERWKGAAVGGVGVFRGAWGVGQTTAEGWIVRFGQCRARLALAAARRRVKRI
jgi:hypothetical protein